jgi:hypothetical protein
VEAAALGPYLTSILGGDVEVLELRQLGGPEADGSDPKGFGYGIPFEIRCRVDGNERSVVMARTRVAQGFGHDYPADRAWQALYGHVAYNSFPAHARSLDVGFERPSGALVSAGDATEFFQLVEKAEGGLYWLDLDRMLSAPARDVDVARARELGTFLARAHAVKRDEPTLYERRIRELVGHGECVMGILDSYPHPYPPLLPHVCETVEQNAVSWRWRLRGRSHRLSRTHGDFHPWNLLFREGIAFSVLDRSRGEWGEPADDVSALAINYLFFGLRRAAADGRRGVAEPFAALFRHFIDAYQSEANDGELWDVIPPFLAFRALVIGHPRWYPSLSARVRSVLLALARVLMAGGPVLPERILTSLESM